MLLTLKTPSNQPWHAFYHFRFTKARSDGSRVPQTTRILAITEAAAREELTKLLGSSGYKIEILGLEEVPMAAWPPASRLACGFDLKGRRRPTRSSGAAVAGVPAGKPRPARLP